MERKPNGFCNTCPRKLDKSPNEPCPLAMERIEALKGLQATADKKKDLDDLPGCPWYTNSAEHNYCFWRQVMSHDGKIDAFEDKEIMDSLGLTQNQLDKTSHTALAKFKAKRHTPEFQELKEHLADFGTREIDNSVYLPSNFLQERTIIDTTDDVRVLRENGKTQMYGLYSDKKLQKIADEKTKKKSTKTK